LSSAAQLYEQEGQHPLSADKTARHQFQATGQPVSRTQASDAMTSRLPRYEAKRAQRRCFDPMGVGIAVAIVQRLQCEHCGAL